MRRRGAHAAGWLGLGGAKRSTPRVIERLRPGHAALSPSHPIVVLLLASLLGGCGGNAALDPAIVPQPFEMELTALHNDQRAMYFVVTKDRELHFGGGLAAHARNATPAGVLSEQQIGELWRIIVEGGLFDVKGQFMPKVREVRYDVRLRGGGRSRSFACADDRAPALGALEAALHRWYTEYQAQQVLKPVERAIQNPPQRRR